jgi:hypothetical protein
MGKKRCANVLAEHFANVFKMYDTRPEEDEREILHVLETHGRLITPIKKFKLSEVRSTIKQLRSKKKAPGRDFYHGKNLKGVTRCRNKSYHPNIQQRFENRVFPGPMEGLQNYHSSEAWETS